MIYAVIIAIIALGIIIAGAIESRQIGGINENVEELIPRKTTVVVVREKKKWDPIHDYTHRHDEEMKRHKENQTPW